jgi:hypothetical protein
LVTRGGAPGYDKYGLWPKMRSVLLVVVSFQAEPGTREFGFMANGLLQHSQGQRPWFGVSIILFGQRPYSTVMFWIEYGRWPKCVVWVCLPGAVPLATMNMALGQKCDLYFLWFKGNGLKGLRCILEDWLSPGGTRG